MSFAIKHQISAGSDFDGQVPSTDPTESNGVVTYPADTQGGLFEFGMDTVPVSLFQVLVKLGGQTSWTLEILDGAQTFELASGTTETEYLYRPDEPVILLPGQKVELNTSGASTAMWATAVYARAAIGES